MRRASRRAAGSRGRVASAFKATVGVPWFPTEPASPFRQTLLRGDRGHSFGCDRDFLHDLDDVPVRVEDAQLACRRVTARDELLHAFQLSLRPELARVRHE